MKVACIIPSRGRPAQLRRCIDLFFETTQEHDVECLAIIDGDVEPYYQALTDSAAMLLDGNDAVFNPKQVGAVASWNIGLKALAYANAFIPGADDLIWHPGWLDAALAALQTLPGGQGMVGFNDLDRTDHMATHFLVTRQCIIEVMGGVLAIPAYHHYWTDPEMNVRAKIEGCYVWCEESVVEHRSSMNGKAPEDDTYRLARKYFKADEETFNRRQAAGFPNDFEPVLR